eukprot:CAMPEP_0194249106 /NCGR_PEP_ID=MMETSP0158-20130606/19787_1 /TAXON_ID=33649 /ORGANISM="Thalassionema nitzschioides, Strain L26-B" /LENGTH=719 /DNA_ID=CAMNT_0038985551 /DNA_START=214 /DNA_END=2374 /DNA_ORIENTATION=-
MLQSSNLKSCLKCSEDLESCPACEASLGKLDCLKTSQPLAHRVLTRVKVRCTFRKCKCRWTGEYKNLLSHIENNHRRKPRRDISNGNKHSTAIGNVESGGVKCHERKNPGIEVGEESQPEPLSKHASSSDVFGGNPFNDATKKQVPVTNASSNYYIVVDDESNANDSYETSRTKNCATNCTNLSGLVVSPPDDPLPKAQSSEQLPPPLPKKKSKEDVTSKQRQFREGKKQSSSKSMSSRHDDQSNEHDILTRTRSDNTFFTNSYGKGQQRSNRSSSWKKSSSSRLHSRSPCRSRSTDRHYDVASSLDPSSSPLLKFQSNEGKVLQSEKGGIQLHKSSISCNIETPSNQGIEYDEVTNESFSHSLRAEAELRANHYEACIKSSVEAMRVHQGNVNAYLHKANAETELGLFDAAIKTLSLGIERIPSSRELMQRQKVAKQTHQVMKTANYLMNAEMFEELIQVTEKVDKNVYNNFLLLLRAKAFLCLNLFDRATETATEIYENDTESSDSLVIRANARYLNGHVEDALADCKTVLTLNPERESIRQLHAMFQNVREWLSLAEQASQNNLFQKACSLFEMAIEAAEPQSLPQSSPLYRKLFLAKASALLYAGVYSKALDTVNMLLKHNTSDVDGWNIKIDALEKLDRKKELLQELHNAVVINKWGAEYPLIAEKYHQMLQAGQDQTKVEDTGVNPERSQVTLSNSDVDSFELIHNKLSSTAA